ncbi:MAG: phenylalanine--tRNA ligase subunit beta [Candidatus Peribacteraceae bacterium]|nr:phenylalanine--tRNA ligase subunit beta [Candidatus Peribacteraceae bacterium]
MKISLEWLSEFVDFTEKDPAKIADRITACTAEVEEMETQGAGLRECCVGKVLTLSKHPHADRLALCDVQTDRGKKRVVCGGTNLRVGMRVAFAHVGARVRWHGEEMMTLEKTKIRGEESEGMICAAEELGLASLFPECTGHSVIDLGDGEAGVGSPLASYLKLGDTVLHVDNHAITQRPDLFSHIGFARECVALGLAHWKKKRPPVPSLTYPRTPPPFSIEVTERPLVPRYCACTLAIDGLGTTPDWMKRRLEATGWRSINLPIDITNYVMMETGMPLHSFDAADIHGSVRMRRARKGERIRTLDEVDRELSEGALIMEDEKGIFDLLGIMGGLRGSTKDSTRSIWLHSAVVDAVNTRRTVIAMGHRTDAATIYEKGVPHVAAEQGLRRALELFLVLVPGARITSKCVSWGKDGTPRPIPFSAKDAERVLGVKIPEKATKKILTDLGFTVQRKGVTPPLWRLGDVTGAHDLYEEIGRIYDYNRIPSTMPVMTVEPPPRDQRVHRLRDSLKAGGFLEVMPLSLVGPELLRACKLHPSAAIEVENPLGEELSLFQTSTLPRLLEHASRSLLSAGEFLRTFECAHVASREQGEWLECGMLIAEKRQAKLAEESLLQLRQILLEELRGSGLAVSFRASEKAPPFGHPGRSSDIFIGGKVVGLLCEIHPLVRSAFDLPGRVSAALLDLTTLLAITPSPSVFQSLSQFPAITYDLTVPRDHQSSAEALLRKAQAATQLLESVVVTDLYDGPPLQTGQYNLTLRCTYRAPDRTLTEEEAKREHQKVEAVVRA